MSIFNRRATRQQTGQARWAGRRYTADDGPLDHQDAVIEMLDDFSSHDLATLAQLTPELRAKQLRARQTLHRHIDGMWDRAKASLHPADGNPPDGWLDVINDIAAMRDLTSELVAHVEQAQTDAGDQEDATDEP